MNQDENQQAAAAVTEEAKPADRQQHLTFAQKSAVIDAIKAAAETAPDAEVAAAMTDKLGRDVSPALVGSYRVKLGLASVKRDTREVVEAKLAKANATIVTLTQTVGGLEARVFELLDTIDAMPKPAPDVPGDSSHPGN